MVGESAGAYVLCRLLAGGARPKVAVLQGALYRSIAGLIEFNAARARGYWERGSREREWMWSNARREYESAVTGESAPVAEVLRSVGMNGGLMLGGVGWYVPGGDPCPIRIGGHVFAICGIERTLE